MKHFRSVIIYTTVLLLICTFHCSESGRGGGSRGGGSRGGFGGGSRSKGFSLFSFGSSSKTSSSSKSSSTSSFASPSSSQSVSSGVVHKPYSTAHSSSHILPVSTGNRNPSNTINNPNKNGLNNPNHLPSAPPYAGNTNPNAPSSFGSSNQQIHKQNVQGLGNSNYSPSAPPYPGAAPPPYPGGANHHSGIAPPPYPGGANHHSGIAPPPYPGGANHNSGIAPPPYPGNVAPPPYPGTRNSYPNGPPPPYSVNHNSYPNGPPPPYSSGTHHSPTYTSGNYPQMGSTHYSAHTGSNYYPSSHSLPPPPPGYTPYGVPYYQKPKSGIDSGDVLMGIALWQLMRPSHHHHHHYSYGGDSGYYNSHNYHDINRQRYTTTYTSEKVDSNKPQTYNTLEMTHYVVPNESGVYKTTVGNMTCMSIYNTHSMNKWANKTVEDFYKKFPNSTFPLFETNKTNTNYENFTITPGRIIHQEIVSFTCCGTDKEPIELEKLTNGKSKDVNCVHFFGKIPFRKIIFEKVINNEQQPNLNINMKDWHPIKLMNINSSSTPTPLAPYPTTTEPSVDLSQTFSPLGINSTTSSVNFNQTYSSLDLNNSVTTAPSVDANQTFSSLGLNISSKIESVNLNHTFNSLGVTELSNTNIDLNQNYSSTENITSTNLITS